jgi:hypothetical protein
MKTLSFDEMKRVSGAGHFGDVRDANMGKKVIKIPEVITKGRCEQVPDMRSSYSSGAHPRGTS